MNIKDVVKIIQTAESAQIATFGKDETEGFPEIRALLNLANPKQYPKLKDKAISVDGETLTIYFTTNTFSLRVAHYQVNPKACIYFCDDKGFQGMMLRGTMEILTDEKTKKMIWRDGDTEYYPGGVTDPNYCVLKFTATDGRFYSDFYPRSFVID